MEPIFNRLGAVVGWIHGGRILDRSNRYRGFFNGDAIHSMSGKYIGRMHNGFIRDKAGGAVAFVKGASGGPIPPITHIPPIPPIPSIPPISAIPAIPSIPAIPLLSWGIDWDVFLNS